MCSDLINSLLYYKLNVTMRLLTKIRTFKSKSIILSAVIIALYVLITIVLEMWFATNREVVNKPLVLPYVVVHIDLKGTPLKLIYLETLLPKLKLNGANSLLMEYEDMFPFEGKIRNLTAGNCYKKTELKRFLTTAKTLELEVIPLVQTFGHLEHALKLAEFQHLREVPQHPDSICPSNLATMELVKDMIQQIIEFHDAVSPLKFVHIGCDEVFHLNKCRHCLKRNLTKSDIFLHHVRTVADVVKSLNVDTTVLIWDDMLRQIKPNEWIHVDYFDNVQPVYWDYTPQIRVTHVNLLKYHRKFKHVWIATAFKGADGRVATFPVSNNRFLNLLSWLNFIKGYRFGGESAVYHFKGIIMTGWSRYSHMDPPCELLPVAFPNLVIHLLLIQKFKTVQFASDETRDLQIFIDRHLTNSTLECDFVNKFDETKCIFDGQHLFIALKDYVNLINALRSNFNVEELGIPSLKYYSRVGILNTNMVKNHIDELNSNLKTLTKLERRITKEMHKYYENDFIIEYMNFKMQYQREELQNALNSLNGYLKIRTWSRRSKNSSYYFV